MSVDYIYNLRDFKNQQVSTTKLQSEIEAVSSITQTLDYITVNGSDVTLGFGGSLGDNEVSLLDNIVEDHDGVDSVNHKTLRDLIHFIDSGPADGFASGSYMEVYPSSSPFPTKVTWWDSISKVNKIVEEEVTYNSNKSIATSTWRMYGSNGILVSTVTDTTTCSGIFEISRIRIIS